jgi:hypothetical protein
MFRLARTMLAVAAIAALSATGVSADPACDPQQVANGPFEYSPASLGTKTFLGTDNTPFNAVLTITAPGKAGDTWFPAASNGPCSNLAPAQIGVLGIERVGDEDGAPLDPTQSVETDSPLGIQIAAAFAIVPAAHDFAIAEQLEVAVTVSNPLVSPADYGDYIVVIKAHAPGTGVGTGSGARVLLQLRAPAFVDVVPPDVTVSQPQGDKVLGAISVAASATDPTPGTGVAAFTASVSSQGGTVSNLAIPLSLDQTLPVAAGVTVNGAGTFRPTGWSGAAGTTLANAFDAASRSGIGSYTLLATATDVAGNSNTAAGNFAVKYNVQFTTANVPNPNCATAGNGACHVQLKFSVNRSSSTSDGFFMFDKTVKVELALASDPSAVKATHLYGTGAIHSDVQIDDSVPEYRTTFRRDGTDATGARTYVAKVYFRDVDGTWMLQTTSAAVTF